MVLRIKAAHGTWLAAAMGAFLFFAPLAPASPWVEPGDEVLRHDIQLLVDAGVIHRPSGTWPMPWPEISADVLKIDASSVDDPLLSEALWRMQNLARGAANQGISAIQVRAALSEDPIRLRTFNHTPRENKELEAQAGWSGGRWAANVDIALAPHARDDRSLRLDGSYLGAAVGNFLVSIGSMDRWWGPGWEGSLILSSNARPMPAITIDRNYSDPFGMRPFRWLGPWTFSAILGRAEDHDVAVPGTLFFAARVNFRPVSFLEIGLSRTAQWCGSGRPCDFKTFGDLLLGHDNRSATLNESEEPGNQMAGYDFRVRNPWRRVPLALYGQLIGEDEAGGLPSRLLGLAGVEVWGRAVSGSFRIHAEYANTACNFSRQTPLFDCAYRNGLYPQGYAYRDRSIGHSLDNDGLMYSLGFLWSAMHGDSWSLLVRRIDLNRGGAEPDLRHTASVAEDALNNLELQYNRAFVRGTLRVGIGFDEHDGSSTAGTDVRTSLQWTQGF